MSMEPAPATEPQKPVSPIGRIIGMFFSPKTTFEDIVRKPSWLLPVVLMMIFGALVAVSLNQRMNWREYVSQQIEKSPRAAQLSAEQKEKQAEAGAKFAPYSTYVFGIPAPVVVVLVVSLAMWGAYSLLGGISTDFKTVLGIVSHSFVPAYVSSLLFLLILFLKAPGTIDLENPVATNLAVFLPDESPKWLEALGKNIDIFSFWILILMAIGFGVLSPKKLKGAKSFAIAFSVLGAYVVLRVGLAFIFS